MPTATAPSGMRRKLRINSGDPKYVKITKSVKVKPMKDTQKAGVLAVVRRMLARNIENKTIGWDVESLTPHNNAITAADCYGLVQTVPAIASGTGDSSQQRIGDRIKPKALVVKGLISFQQENLPSAQPLIVRVMILAQKDIKNTAQLSSTATNVLLHPAGASADETAFNGNVRDLLYPVNKNKFRVYMDKQYTLCSGDLAGGNSHEQNTQWFKRFKYSFKDLPANLTYDEANGDNCNNFAPFICIGYAYADGTAPSLVTKIQATVHSQLTFEDA